MSLKPNKYEPSINGYVKAYSLHVIPREEPTEVLYDEYLAYCTNHNIQPRTKTMFTRELRKYGYRRMSATINDIAGKKVYRYTGQILTTCPTCGGKGTLYK